jgi:hypothetical protein
MPLTRADQLDYSRGLDPSVGVGVVSTNTAQNSVASALHAEVNAVALASSEFGQWNGGARRPT